MSGRHLLVDRFGRFHNYLRISLTEKCNLRCVYCMPEEGVKLTPRSHLMTLEERMRTIDLFASLGVDKIRFTGGEPTISKDLVPLVQHAKQAGMKSVGITTNGIELGIEPRNLDRLVANGLTSINISLDTLDPKKFGAISRRDEKLFYRVMSAIFHALSIPELSVKLNAVLMRGVNDNEIADMVALTQENRIDCRFIELMPFDGNAWSPDKMMSFTEAIDHINTKEHSQLGQVKLEKVGGTGDPHDTTKWYRLVDTVNGSPFVGRVGFITSMSSHFCGGCNRLRVTADGKLKVCLFGEEGLSLLDKMRGGSTDDNIAIHIHEALSKKHFAHGGLETPEELSHRPNRPMILIGG